VEWRQGHRPGGLPGSTDSIAESINNAGQAVGYSYVGGFVRATEWSGGKVIDLAGLPGSTYSIAYGINDFGQAVGFSVVGGFDYATEWSHGRVINLGGLPGSIFSEAFSINDFGQAAGESDVAGVPEPSTWAMMLFGFAGLGFASYRSTRRTAATGVRP
jgi:uncharacterized membrane protein